MGLIGGTIEIKREGSIKDFCRRCPLQSDLGEMRVAITLTVLFAGSAFAAPQFEGIKNLFSSLASGDQDEDSGTEKVPYTTLKQFDVSSDFGFLFSDNCDCLGVRDEAVSKCEMGLHRVDL